MPVIIAAASAARLCRGAILGFLKWLCLSYVLWTSVYRIFGCEVLIYVSMSQNILGRLGSRTYTARWLHED